MFSTTQSTKSLSLSRRGKSQSLSLSLSFGRVKDKGVSLLRQGMGGRGSLSLSLFRPHLELGLNNELAPLIGAKPHAKAVDLKLRFVQSLPPSRTVA